MGSPLSEASWNSVTGAYYAGAGSSELLWIVISLALVFVALVVGARHEVSARFAAIDIIRLTDH